MRKSIYVGLIFPALVLAGTIPMSASAQQTFDGIKQDQKDNAATMVVTAKQFEIGVGKLNGKSIGPPRQINGLVCHDLTREDYYIVTGINPGKRGGIYCHFH